MIVDGENVKMLGKCREEVDIVELTSIAKIKSSPS
jgi:hypothetical protein